MKMLGKTDIQLTPISLGSWQVDDTFWKGRDLAEIERGLAHSIELGMTTIDTARCYGDGAAETMIGKLFKDKRKSLVYCSKVIQQLSHQEVIDNCEQSLKCLQTDYVDLYYIHWPSGSFGEPTTPIEETMQALMQLKQQGKIRAIGLSNFSLEQLQDAQKFGEIDAVQPPYSLIDRRLDDNLVNYCLQNQITVFPYSPLAAGLLTGKYNDASQVKDIKKFYHILKPQHVDLLNDLNSVVSGIAQNHQVSNTQVVLAWYVQKNLNPIVGIKNAAQAEDAANALKLILTDEEMQRIDTASKETSSIMEQYHTMADLVGAVAELKG